MQLTWRKYNLIVCFYSIVDSIVEQGEEVLSFAFDIDHDGAVATWEVK